MRTKHQNIGQWRAIRYPDEKHSLLKITALLPTNHPAAHITLKALEQFSSEDYGLVYLLENAEELNVQSTAQTYICSRAQLSLEDRYRKIIIIGFLPGEKHSILIAMLDIQTSMEVLP
ncbi:hypothetical protein [Pedobacter aquatilis]|uniref:hypothetical protein n=1 Tax=Pedobacter aquatilis TaxID=351343 RepID=UPI002931002E|nr:hypothetical protein [Pedobacter aquatilis]